jgi:methanogenesis imperfect marker protein 11
VVTYVGLGGGGVGAAGSRSRAGGLARAEADPCGGGKRAGATVWVPLRRRVLIGVDDTDTPEAGATWTLAHNIARAVESDDDVYLSHTIVQLYPVSFRTKNCVGIVVEFASRDPWSARGPVPGAARGAHALGRDRHGRLLPASTRPR